MEHPKLKEICASHVIEFACFLDLNFQSCDLIDVNNFITGAEEGGKGEEEGEGGRGRGRGRGRVKGRGKGDGGRGKGKGEGKGKGKGGRGKGKGEGEGEGKGKGKGGREKGEGGRGKGEGGRVDTAPQNLSPDYALIYIYIRTVMKTVEVHTM